MLKNEIKYPFEANPYANVLFMNFLKKINLLKEWEEAAEYRKNCFKQAEDYIINLPWRKFPQINWNKVHYWWLANIRNAVDYVWSHPNLPKHNFLY